MSVLELEATITSRGQTTVPAAIRKALGVDQGVIVYRLDGNGTVTLARKDADEVLDPAIGAFLRFLETDIEVHPEGLRLATATWVQSLRDLVAGVEIDFDQPLCPEDD
jgi:antitoxin PrlF